ncbi:MAG TPA: putative Ig domain-containing protein, partial [Labilithrix sp.]|nr:putative Ig domain-containing protein [Labilithrix sp.]
VTAGLPTPTLDVVGALPAGLSLVNGVIEGTPATGSVGVYPLSLTVSNGVLPNATQTLNLEVAKASQTIVLGDLENQIIGPQKIQVTATASSQLAVALASTTPSVCTISAGTVSLASVGVCTISASQVGNADYEAAPTLTKSFQIAAPPAPDASTSDGSAAPEGTPSTTPESVAPATPDASTHPVSVTSRAIEGGGCQCDQAGAPAPAGGLLFGLLGLVFGLGRRRRARD